MRKGCPKHQRNHWLQHGLRKGAEMTRNLPPKRKKRFFCAQNHFLAPNNFLSKKLGNDRKSAKRVNLGSKTPRKALATVGLARWERKWRFRHPKNALFRIFRTFAPKTRFCRTFPLLAQKAQNPCFGRILEQKWLIFLREFNDFGKGHFAAKKLLPDEEKMTKILSSSHLEMEIHQGN